MDKNGKNSSCRTYACQHEMTLNNDFMYILFISVKTRKGGTWADPRKGARVPG